MRAMRVVLDTNTVLLIASQAEYLITGDRDLLVLVGEFSVPIVLIG